MEWAVGYDSIFVFDIPEISCILVRQLVRKVMVTVSINNNHPLFTCDEKENW